MLPSVDIELTMMRRRKTRRHLCVWRHVARVNYRRMPVSAKSKNFHAQLETGLRVAGGRESQHGCQLLAGKRIVLSDSLQRHHKHASIGRNIHTNDLRER